jgi:hypothetical protein
LYYSAYIFDIPLSFSVVEIEMDGLAILIGVLTFLFLVVLFYMNYNNAKQEAKSIGIDGFQDVAKAGAEAQIRAVLDPMIVPEICPLYTTIRTNMKKNEMAGENGATAQEAEKRVEASLAIKIPGGALPCPLIKYPRAGATDLDWLDFIQKVPTDFGARVVFMAIYAKEFLEDKEKILKDTLSGDVTVPVAEEGFVVCTPDLADTRRAERSKKSAESCTLPEDLTPEQIHEAIAVILKQLVSRKNTALKEKKIDPLMDIRPLIKAATKSAAYINKKSEEAQSGTLQMDGPIKNPERPS